MNDVIFEYIGFIFLKNFIRLIEKSKKNVNVAPINAISSIVSTIELLMLLKNVVQYELVIHIPTSDSIKGIIK